MYSVLCMRVVNIIFFVVIVCMCVSILVCVLYNIAFVVVIVCVCIYWGPPCAGFWPFVLPILKLIIIQPSTKNNTKCG